MITSAIRFTSGRALAVAVLGLVLYGCGGTVPDQALGAKPETPVQEQKSGAPAPSSADKESQEKPIPGYKAPDIIGRDVATGDPVLLSSLKGQVVMVNFWATWCGPCRYEMPAMEELHKEGKVKILAVGADDREKPEQLAAFAQELGLTFSVLHDGGAGMMAYRVLGLPTSVFVDQNGIIRARHTGPMTLEQMRELAAETEKMGSQQ